MRSHREIAGHLDATGLPVTYLAPSLFMENLLEAADTIRDQATIFAPAGAGRIGFVAADDVAKVAARVLTSPGHDDMLYVLTGPQALGYADVAAEVSAVFAREVEYQDMPEQAAREKMLASGLSPWQTDGSIELFEWIRAGGADAVTSTVRDVTGADAQPLADWLGDRRGVFIGWPPGLAPPASSSRRGYRRQSGRLTPAFAVALWLSAARASICRPRSGGSFPCGRQSGHDRARGQRRSRLAAGGPAARPRV